MSGPEFPRLGSRYRVLLVLLRREILLDLFASVVAPIVDLLAFKEVLLKAALISGKFATLLYPGLSSQRGEYHGKVKSLRGFA